MSLTEYLIVFATVVVTFGVTTALLSLYDRRNK
jgi:hypothetical protein